MTLEGSDTERVSFQLSDALFELAEREVAAIIAALRPLLPSSAEFLHIGATSVPGCLTKGDLDVVARVDAGDFQAARDALDAALAKNLGSVRDEAFASYKVEDRRLPTGLQLVARGSILYMTIFTSSGSSCAPNLPCERSTTHSSADGKGARWNHTAPPRANSSSALSVPA